MNESDNHFLNHIKSVLREHEEPYEEGAWERFINRQTGQAEQRRLVPLWKWGIAAAVLIAAIFLGARVFNFYTKDSAGPASPPIVMHHKPKENKATDTPAAGSSSDKTTTTPDINPFNPPSHQNMAYSDNKSKPHMQITARGRGYDANADTRLYEYIPETLQPQTAPVTTTVSPPPQQPDTPSEVDFWKNKAVTTQPPASDQRFTTASTPTEKSEAAPSKNRKWQPSLYLSPLFGDQGMNMGYGFSIGYAVNDKISINSGVAHARISTSRSFSTPDPAALTPSASMSGTDMMSAASFDLAADETSTLQQVEGLVSGIDVPLEVHYRFSNRFYAAGGVSGLIVTNDRKNFTYRNSRNVKISVETNKGVVKEDKSVVFSESRTLAEPLQTPGETTPFLGFYNLSVGYRQKISDKNAVSLEPFIKVPMKNVTQQNLNYSGAGVRLKFDF